MRKSIPLTLATLAVVLTVCGPGEVEEFGAETKYLNECRPYDLLLKDLLETFSTERMEELLTRTDDLGMTVPVDEDILNEIEKSVEKLRLFNFTAPTEDLAELGEMRESAFDAAVSAADILLEVKSGYDGLVAAYDAGEVDLEGRKTRVRAFLDSYRTARDKLEIAEKLLPELLKSVGEKS